MAKKPNILIRFWQELKRRKVFKVLAMYAGTAFIIIQVEGSLADPLNLPRWVGTLMVILLCVGFPVTAILAWIFDLTPEGIKKTESIEELKGKEIITAPSRRKLKISDVVIVVLAIAVTVLLWPKIFKKDTVERLKSSGQKITVAVMPFKNLTNDTLWNIYQEGIQQCLISSLSNTAGELKVKPQESTNKLLQSKGVNEYASMSATTADIVSKKLETDFFIYGNIMHAGPKIRVDVNLIDTKTNEVFKSFKQEGESSEKSIFPIIDSLSQKLTDFLIISQLIKENPVYGFFGYPGTTKSPEAFRYYIYGSNAFAKMDYPTARSWFEKALAVDSNYFDPASFLAYSYGNVGMFDKYIPLVLKIYSKRNQWPPTEQLVANTMYATEFEPMEVTIRYAKQLKEIDGIPSYFLGLCYNAIEQYDNAIEEWEECLKTSRKWGREFLKESWAFLTLGEAYHKTGQYKKEKKLYKEAEKVNDDHKSMYFGFILRRQAILAFTQGDSVSANKYLQKNIEIVKGNFSSEADFATSLGRIYSEAGVIDKAEVNLRKALRLEPQNSTRMNNLAWFLFDKGRNINEGLDLIEKALELDPDNYEFLGTKGWGLYKLGKKKKALEYLEKSDSIPQPYHYVIKNRIKEVKKSIAEEK